MKQRKPKQWCSHNSGQTDPPQRRLRHLAPYQPWPHEVELLLRSKAPRMEEIERPKPAQRSIKWKNKVRSIEHHHEVPWPPVNVQHRSQHQREQEERVVQRKQAKHPPHIEVAEVVFPAALIIQNRRNQISRQYEEDPDAH